jgi:hypothetical protein
MPPLGHGTNLNLQSFTINNQMDGVMIDCTFSSRISHLCGDVTIAEEKLQNLSFICFVLRAFEQGGIFIVPHLL